MKKLIRVVFELVLILGIMLLAGKVIQKNKDLDKVSITIEKLEETNENLKETNKDYENSLIELRKSINDFQEAYFSQADLYLLGAQSTEEAKTILWKSLQTQEDKIPAHPVLGGRFYFSKGAPIKNKWYVAEVEDGHIRGVLLYKYALQPNGTISWKVIDSHFD